MLADALIVIDLQNGVCHGSKPIANLNKLIKKVNQRIEKYWSHDKSVIFIQHNDQQLVRDSVAWALLPTINSYPEAYYVQKTHANAFYKTKLQALLITNNIESLEICGAQTEYCVDATIKMAHGLGYQIQMKKGLSTTFDNEFMTANQTIAFYESIWQGRFLQLR